MAKISKLSISQNDFASFRKVIQDTLNNVIDQLNNISAGQLAATTNAFTGPPTSATAVPYAQGDYVKNSAPTVLGTAGSQYVILGWVCVVPGSPGTWVPCEVKTGS